MEERSAVSEASLTTPHPADRSSSTGQELPHVPGSTFFLPVDRISLYDHNVRLAPNPERARLKASILASGGLTTPLAVTKRPHSNEFMVHHGGNTRLEILQELAAETPADERRFDRVRVVYEIYTTELDIAVNHDRENNLRGGLSFIEQAKGKRHQYDLYLQEAGSQATVKDFCRFMHKKYGDDITPEMFYRMRYASDTLFTFIPTILVQGRMTLGAVRELIAFRKKLQSVWIDHRFGDKKGFEAVFYELLARQDREIQATLSNETLPDDARLETLCRLDYGRIKVDFQNELAEMDGVRGADYKLIGLWVGAALNSDDLEQYESVADLDTNVPSESKAANTSTQPQARKKSKPRPPGEDVAAPAPPLPTGSPVDDRPIPPFSPNDIKSLRARCYTYAAKIAQRNGFAELIKPIPSAGHGFVVSDIFPDHWWDTLPAEQLAVRKEAWWLLALCSHVFDLPGRTLSRHLPDDSQVRNAFVEQNITVISRTMGVFGVNTHLAHIREDDWSDLIELLTAYRQLIAAQNRSVS